MMGNGLDFLLEKNEALITILGSLVDRAKADGYCEMANALVQLLTGIKKMLETARGLEPHTEPLHAGQPQPTLVAPMPGRRKPTSRISITPHCIWVLERGRLALLRPIVMECISKNLAEQPDEFWRDA
jgi:hypothetical protein